MSRKTDQAIATAANRLARIQRKDSSALSAGDQAKYFAAATVSIGQGIRRRNAPMADRAIERIWADAEAVAKAELAAAQQAKNDEVAAKVAARAERKSKGWF
ncbi:hypothetical protein ACWEP8_39755 [Streptomyces hydrogenans]